jgi:hypothetical protein
MREIFHAAAPFCHIPKQYNIFLTDCKNNFEAFTQISSCGIFYLLNFALLREEERC